MAHRRRFGDAMLGSVVFLFTGLIPGPFQVWHGSVPVARLQLWHGYEGLAHGQVTFVTVSLVLLHLLLNGVLAFGLGRIVGRMLRAEGRD